METGDIAGANGWDAGADVAERCPPEAVVQPVIDKNALDAQARKTMPVAVRQAPAEPLTKAIQTVPAEKAEDLLTARLLAWASAWSSKAVDRYLGFYGESFKPKTMAIEAWREQRKRRLSTREPIAVTITDIQVAIDGEDRAETRFQQRYESGAYVDQGEKILQWQRINGEWFIVSESGR